MSCEAMHLHRVNPTVRQDFAEIGGHCFRGRMVGAGCRADRGRDFTRGALAGIGPKAKSGLAKLPDPTAKRPECVDRAT